MQGGAGTYARSLTAAIPSIKLVSNVGVENAIGIRGFTSIPRVLTLLDLLRLITKYDVKCVICQSTPGLLLSIFLRLFHPNIRIINVYHGLASHYYGRGVLFVEKLSSLIATQIIVTNKVDGYSLLRDARQVFVPNCAAGMQPEIKSDPAGDLVTVTRLSSQKDTNTLKEFALTVKRTLQVYCPENEITAFQRELINTSSNCSFTGNKNEIYSGKSIFLLSTFSEGFPMSIIEAANFGLPIVLSDIPVLKMLFGDNALYFDSADSLSSQIEFLLNSRSNYEYYQLKSIELADSYSERYWLDNWNSILDSD